MAVLILLALAACAHEGIATGPTGAELAPGAPRTVVLPGPLESPLRDPVYVLNGVLVDEEAFPELAPADIEKVEIMKGARAVPLFGPRAANGVVVITTRVRPAASQP
jgi:Ca-activated chloride channel homolog